MSVTSSITPGRLVNSCSAPLMLDVGDGRAFEAGEQDAAEAVADRRAEAALERLGGEFAVGVGGNLLVPDHPQGSSRPRQRILMIDSPLSPSAELRKVTAPTVGGHLSSASSARRDC